MKKSELIFAALLVVIDWLLIVAAGLTAYALRYWTFVQDIRPVIFDLALSEWVNIVLIVATLFIVVFALSGLYIIRSTRRMVDEIGRIFFAVSTGVLFVILLIFFQRELFSSRFIILAGWVVAFFYVTIGRTLIYALQHALFSRGIGTHRVVLVGADRTTTIVQEYLAQHPKLGYRVFERFDGITDESLRRIDVLAQENKIDEVIQADASLPRNDVMKLVDLASDRHKIFRYTADIMDAKVLRIDVKTLAGIPIIEIKRTPLDGWGKILKQIYDFIVALVLLAILSPLFLLVAILIRLEGKGPIFFASNRIGQSGRPFSMYKFRSMVPNAEKLKEQLMQHNERSGPLFKMKNDPRITRVGRFIRKTSIDELPQLFNVLRFEMSLVGPRPHEPGEVDKYDRQQRKLLTIKPGITGMAQISGRSDLEFNEEVKLDLYYIEHWSLLLDMSILARTPMAVLGSKHAA
ncbi:MAG: sugar transferase [Patescibacteria group bacterium]|jgi:exopolysaccharide biosynthesis polyprenyl glycosylphosphotransferase